MKIAAYFVTVLSLAITLAYAQHVDIPQPLYVNRPPSFEDANTVPPSVPYRPMPSSRPRPQYNPNWEQNNYIIPSGPEISANSPQAQPMGNVEIMQPEVRPIVGGQHSQHYNHQHNHQHQYENSQFPNVQEESIVVPSLVDSESIDMENGVVVPTPKYPKPIRDALEFIFNRI